MTRTDIARPPIVSSAHLASSGMPELSEMEFALTHRQQRLPALDRTWARCGRR